MALMIVDGFDHYNSVTDFLARSGYLQWQFPTSAPGFTIVTGLNGVGKALQLTHSVTIGSSDQTVRGVIQDRNQEGIHAFRFNLPAATNLSINLVDTVSGAVQISLFFNSGNYSITAYRGSGGGATLLQISPNNAWVGATNQFVEIHYKIASSGGVIEVKMQSMTFAIQYTGNTQASANAWADAIDMEPQIPGGGLGSVTWKIDDYRYQDTATDPGASANNTFIGDLGIFTYFATGDGSVQWTPNSGSNNYSRVNEVAMDGDTTYNFSATPGQEDQLTFQPITQVAGIIYGVFVTIATRKDDVGPRIVKTGLKSSGTVGYGSNHSVPDTFCYFTDRWILDPNTSANWTRTGFNNVLGLYNLVS